MKKKIVVASNLLESIVKSCSIEEIKVLKTFSGSEFVGTICEHPFKKFRL